MTKVSPFVDGTQQRIVAIICASTVPVKILIEATRISTEVFSRISLGNLSKWRRKTSRITWTIPIKPLVSCASKITIIFLCFYSLCERSLAWSTSSVPIKIFCIGARIIAIISYERKAFCSGRQRNLTSRKTRTIPIQEFIWSTRIITISLGSKN